MEQFSQGKSQEEKKKIKDMMRMLDIIKALDSPQKPKEEGKFLVLICTKNFIVLILLGYLLSSVCLQELGL